MGGYPSGWWVCLSARAGVSWLFTATPNDDGATAAMTTNCGQPSTPNSVIGAATLTTTSHGTLREAPQSGRWQADPHRRRAAPRSGSGAAALPGVTTCGRPRSYRLRQVDAEAARMPTKPAEPSAPSMTRSSSPSAAVNSPGRVPAGPLHAGCHLGGGLGGAVVVGVAECGGLGGRGSRLAVYPVVLPGQCAAGCAESGEQRGDRGCVADHDAHGVGAWRVLAVMPSRRVAPIRARVASGPGLVISRTVRDWVR
jgi:hypothetical protein